MKFEICVIIFIGMIFTACTGKTILLRGENGDLAKCEVRAGETFLTGVIIRDMTLAQCIKQYEAAGYKKIEPPSPQ